MARRPYNPLAVIPSPETIRQQLTETLTLAERLRILLELAERLRLPLVTGSETAAPDAPTGKGARRG
jgi:hypothetical protein